MATATIHSDDLLAQSNWELSEEWFMRFGCVSFFSLSASVSAVSDFPLLTRFLQSFGDQDSTGQY